MYTFCYYAKTNYIFHNLSYLQSKNVLLFSRFKLRKPVQTINLAANINAGAVPISISNRVRPNLLWLTSEWSEVCPMSVVGATAAFHSSLYIYSIQIFTLRTLGTLDECSNVRSMQFDEASAVYVIQVRSYWSGQYCELIEPIQNTRVLVARSCILWFLYRFIYPVP